MGVARFDSWLAATSTIEGTEKGGCSGESMSAGTHKRCQTRLSSIEGAGHEIQLRGLGAGSCTPPRCLSVVLRPSFCTPRFWSSPGVREDSLDMPTCAKGICGGHKAEHVLPFEVKVGCLLWHRPHVVAFRFCVSHPPHFLSGNGAATAVVCRVVRGRGHLSAVSFIFYHQTRERFFRLNTLCFAMGGFAPRITQCILKGSNSPRPVFS